jgi:hypothetical protein
LIVKASSFVHGRRLRDSRNGFGLVWVSTIGCEACATLFAGLSLVSLEGLQELDLSGVSFL